MAREKILRVRPIRAEPLAASLQTAILAVESAVIGDGPEVQADVAPTLENLARLREAARQAEQQPTLPGCEL